MDSIDKTAPPAAGRISLTGKKKALFRHISLAKEYVQGTTFMEVDMSAVRACRQIRKASYTSYIVYAAAQAIPGFPLLNSTLGEGEIILKQDVNIGVAVDAAGRLLVPVIAHTDTYSPRQIDGFLQSFREKALASQVSPADLEGATFTVTNSGVYGSAFFTPVISYPQSAILGIAAITDKPVVREGEIVIRPMCTFCLSYDHRVVEGSVAVGFLAKVKEILETMA